MWKGEKEWEEERVAAMLVVECGFVFERRNENLKYYVIKM